MLSPAQFCSEGCSPKMCADERARAGGGRLVAVGSEIGILLPNNQRKHRTLHIQEDVLPHALC